MEGVKSFLSREQMQENSYWAIARMRGMDVQITKCDVGVQVVSDGVSFILYDLPEFFARHSDAVLLSEKLGGVLPPKEWLEFVYAHKDKINDLLCNKITGRAFWCSTPSVENCFYYFDWYKGVSLGSTFHAIGSVRVFSAV